MTILVRLVSLSPNTATIANYDEIQPKAKSTLPSEVSKSSGTGEMKSATLYDELRILEQEVRTELSKSLPEGTQFEISWDRTERRGPPRPLLTKEPEKGTG
jgi:hypothetical protein